jgi:regulatory protein
VETQEREARLAALAAQIAAVEGRPTDQGGGAAGGERVGARSRDRIPGQPERPDPRSGPADPGSGSDASAGTPGDGSEQEQTAAAKAICLRLLAVAPRPRAGLAQALQRKEIPEHIAEAVLDRLTEVGLIDDVAYAQSFVRVKHRDRALGRTALRTELRKLGVDEEVMSVAVAPLDAAAERARATELVAKRLDSAMAAGSVAARRRLLGLLSRRGYGFDIAVPVVDGAIERYADRADGTS